MDANEFIKEAYRMCNCHNCDECPARGGVCIVSMAGSSSDLERKRYISIVEKWSKEHPIVTNLDKMAEIFGDETVDFLEGYLRFKCTDDAFRKEASAWLGEEYEERKEK